MTATQVLYSIQQNPPPRQQWRRRDWLLVAGAGALGLVMAGAFIRRRGD